MTLGAGAQWLQVLIDLVGVAYRLLRAGRILEVDLDRVQALERGLEPHRDLELPDVVATQQALDYKPHRLQHRIWGWLDMQRHPPVHRPIDSLEHLRPRVEGPRSVSVVLHPCERLVD